MPFQYDESTSQATSQSKGGTLPWYNQMVQSLLGQGVTAAQQPWQVYQGPRVATFGPDQMAAFEAIRGMQGGWQPYLQTAGDIMGQSIGQIQGLAGGPQVQAATGALTRMGQLSAFNPQKQQQFMNPYISNVVNEIGRLGQENLTQSLGQIGGQFSEAGQFGSARQMAAAADAAARAQREISGQQGQALYQAQQAAGQQYGDWANRGIGAQQQIFGGQLGLGQFMQGLGTTAAGLGQQYAGLGQQQQQQGLADVNALLGAGTQQQALRQQVLGANQQRFQEQQMAPWAQFTNLAQLFSGVPTPQFQTSTSSNIGSNWSTNFKKGGLVKKKFAHGGLYEDEEDSDSRSPLSMLARYSLGRREGLLRDIADSPAFQPLPERGTMRSIGEAMMRAAAADPGNWGQAIGMAGTSYFDAQKAREQENQARELTRLKLMESALPSGLDVMRMAGGVGGTEKLTQARGKDGSLWQLSSTDRGYMKLLQPGNYASDIGKAAATAADKDMENAIGLTTEEKKIERNRLVNEYTEMFSRQYAGLGAVSPGGAQAPMAGGPGATGAAPKEPVGTRMPRGAFDLSAGADAARAQIRRIADPAEREAAMGALERQIADVGRAGLKVPTPGEKKEEEEVGGGFGKQFVKLQEDAAQSENRISMLNRMGELLTGVQTGKLTPLGTEIAGWVNSALRIADPWAKDLGLERIDIDENLPNKEAFKALSSQFALQLRNPAGGAGMPGALSDKDREFLQSMAPGLAMSPGGVQQLLDTYMKLEQRSKDVARLARQYREKNPRGTFDAGFQDYLHEWSEQNPLFVGTALEQREYGGTGVPQPGDVVERGGRKFQYVGPRDGDRMNRNNWKEIK